MKVRYKQSKLCTILFGFIFYLLFASIPALGCTNSVIYGPLGPGLSYIDGSNPLIIIHKNTDQVFYVLFFPVGTQAAGGNYLFEHDVMMMGRDWEGSYTWDGTGKPPWRSSTSMNDMGCAIQFSNTDSGTDYPEIREKTPALANNMEELVQLVEPESHSNKVGTVCHKQNGQVGIGYIDNGILTEITPQNPFYITKVDASTGSQLAHDQSNWFHGDPNKFEARDVAYIWHRFNSGSDAAAMSLLNKKIIWFTAAPPSKSPFIPFDLNDPYVYPAFQDGSYYLSADYSLSEIDAIEDIIMAADGTYIGDIRDIQMRIAERLPITPSTTTTTTIVGGISPDTNGDGCVDLNEIIAYIQLWKNGQVTLNELISAIDWWKQGCNV